MMGVYNWLKMLHIISLISWMAGLLYLPRLFVYHAQTDVKSSSSELLKIMEQRLLRLIMMPAMIATWIFGLALVQQGGWLSAGWLHAKLVFVLVLSGFQGYLGVQARSFGQDNRTHSSRYYRILNEVPTVLMIVIVFFVVLKPF